MMRRWSFIRLVWPFALTLVVLQLAIIAAVLWLRDWVSVWVLLTIPTFFVITVLGAITLAIERRWARPLRVIDRAAADLAAGDWSARVSATSHEPYELGMWLNTFAARARQQLAEIQEQWRVLQVLVDTLPDPVMLVEGHRRVTLINAAAGRLLGVTPARAVGRWLGEVVTDRTLLEIFDAVPPSSPAAPVEREIRLNIPDGRRLAYQAVALRTSDGVLLLLRDVTAWTETLRMKTDFVANASHELRTPTAAIKVAFETLREVYAEDPEQSARCIKIIEGHLHRLEEMLRDLLDLSRLETPEMEVQRVPVTTGDLFSNLRGAFTDLAATAGVVLQTSAEPVDATVLSDPRLLDIILKNLTENAIKFTPAGGRVEIRMVVSDGMLQMAVADTGIGIPPEHVHRVFERFYQVNPARTGSAGRGTGLGLSIVKHALHALKGTISISSTPGRGTTISCQVPI
ncbi:MAG TPA: ATP-binding protein [Tepidisphaeraceae bacterium]|jgi:two-component system phosphate regulon sensor histidine kinase PhoR|nr:ATP-binding protein [Tepidisphaeraceae bacterium]